VTFARLCKATACRQLKFQAPSRIHTRNRIYTGRHALSSPTLFRIRRPFLRASKRGGALPRGLPQVTAAENLAPSVGEGADPENLAPPLRVFEATDKRHRHCQVGRRALPAINAALIPDLRQCVGRHKAAYRERSPEIRAVRAQTVSVFGSGSWARSAIRVSPRSTCFARRAAPASTAGSSRCAGSMRAGFSAQLFAQAAMSGSAP
jgi:hypothetical protein